MTTSWLKKDFDQMVGDKITDETELLNMTGKLIAMKMKDGGNLIAMLSAMDDKQFVVSGFRIMNRCDVKQFYHLAR